MKKLVLLILILLLAPGPASGEGSSAKLDRLLGDLDLLRAVTGESVGFSGVEGRFYQLYRQLLPIEAATLPERLLVSPLPIRRSMGLVLLVARDGGRSAGVVREWIGDRGPVTVNPMGCVYSWGSVGLVARELLDNRNSFVEYSKWEPLLSPSALLALDIEILGRDDLVRIHDRVGEDVLGAIEDGKVPLDLGALCDRYPAIPPVRMVKAFGRLRSEEYYSPAQKDVDRWMLDLTGDRRLSTSVRLAAASSLALTYTFRDYESPRPLPIELLRGLPDRDVAIIRRDFTSAREFDVDQKKSAAFARGHILLVPELASALYDLVRHPEDEEERLPDRMMDALLLLSERLDDWQAEWNTFGDVLYRLEAAVREFNPRLRRELGDERYELLIQRLLQEITSDD